MKKTEAILVLFTAYLFRRNIRNLPYNVNFFVKTIGSIQVIIVPNRSTWYVDVVNRTKIASVIFMARGL